MSSMTGFKRADGQRLSPLLAALCGPSTATLNFAARHPTPLVRKLLDANFALVTAPARDAATARDLVVDGGAGPIPARLYEPAGLPDAPGLLVYFHGGGFALGSLDSHANTCKYTARQAACKVLAIGYRKAPEHRMPAAFEDCRAAFRWAVSHAEELGVDPARVAVGGDSAGGQLAGAVSLFTDGGPKPAFNWMMYPVVDGDAAPYDSAWLFDRGPLLSQGNLRDMLHSYVPTTKDKQDERMTIVRSDRLGELPPTYVATAGMDPLRDQGEHFVALAQEAGASVEHERFANMPHGFNLLFVEKTARAATDKACAALARALAPVPVPA